MIRAAAISSAPPRVSTVPAVGHVSSQDCVAGMNQPDAPQGEVASHH